MRPSHARALSEFEARIRARNLAPRTAVLYLGTARRFLGTLEKPLRQVTAADARAYLASRAALLAPAQVASEHDRLRALFRALLQAGLVRADPMAEIRASRVRRAGGFVLTEDAVERLLAAALEDPVRERALRDRALVELAYGAGLRRAELCASLLVDLDLQGEVLRVRRAKRGHDRLLPLPPAALPHVAAYVQEGRPALVAGRERDHGRLLLHDHGVPIKPGRLNDLLDRIARRAGTRATPHALRRSLATHLVRAGASVVAVQELLGHERLDTTAVYVAVERDDLRRVVALLEQGLRR